jgi:hypothetical protein
MATQVQYRRGSTAQNDAFTGVTGEITVDTTLKTLRVHDGSTAGGMPTVGTTTVQTLTNKTLTGPTISAATFSGSSTGTANITLTGTVSATTLTGTLSTAAQPNITSVGTLSSLAVTGNITSGNLSGTSIVGTLTTAAQTNITSVGTLGSLSVTGNITSGNVSGTRGAFTNVAGTLETAAQTNITSVGTLSSLTVTNNITFGGSLIDTGALDISTGANGNISLSPNGTGVVVVNKDIRNGQANGTGNIGASGAAFNTIFAKATSAQYADVAENYRADQTYPVGTVLIFGGDKEVTQSTTNHSTAIAGTVSENPAFIMNTGLESEFVATVALLGRVPCRVIGPVARGDLLVSSHIPGVAQRIGLHYQPGCVIGKALENYNSAEEGIIEVVVGRL